MQKYKLQLNEDINVSYDLTAHEQDEAHQKALSMLGWSVIEEIKTESKNQTVFDFI
jgi:hypothetical protein